MDRDDPETLRRRMVEVQIAGRGISDPRTLQALGRVPRERFVPRAYRGLAYEDRPLPIGEGQTVSQPYMVALMTQALGMHGGEKVLEVGTGSGYQTAVLAEIAGLVYSVERIPSLAERARRTLEALGYENVRVVAGDGSLGLAREAPFDAVLVTAAAPAVPEPLKEQLADGGRLVIPVGSREYQELVRVTRRGDSFRSESLGGCVFVPLLGARGWEEHG